MGSGRYTPCAIDSVFLLTESSHSVFVTPDFPTEKLKIVTPLKDTEAQEGQEVVLNCEVNTDTAKAKWLKNEETVFESSKYMMVQRDNVFSLRIKDAQKGDEANFSISVTNLRGEHAKSACNLSVKGECVPMTF